MQNFIKTILSAMKTWTKKEIKNSTADWNQNDSNAVDYVKNRTHWDEKAVIVKEQVVSGFSLMQEPIYAVLNPFNLNPIVGNVYTVIWDGVSYELEMVVVDEAGGLGCIGNTNYAFMESGGNIPFAIIFAGDIFLVTESIEDSHTISIYESVIHKLDSKYLDLPTNLATTDDVQSIANNKMDKNNPVGTGSFSMNRKAETTVGFYSYAEGKDTTASGSYSHAEGYNTQATTNTSATASATTSKVEGYAAHAEGYGTVACGAVSHAEGNGTTAFGSSSHAEGYSTEARGIDSHAEGSSTLASGAFSHAEGSDTIASGGSSHTEGSSTSANGTASHAEGSHTSASGKYSHAEGEYTVAQRPYQHVQGLYNILDTVGNPYNTKGKYAHIVGNGASETERSNAHTLDWNGVGWFQGGLQVGGNAQDDGAKNVLLEGDAIATPIAAQVGQTIVVSEVDENGKPTKWEAADVGSDIEVDTTLTVEGQAADAKAVGDALAVLEEKIPESGGGITEETDPTVPAWAKADTKPTYTAAEVGALPLSGGTMTGELRVNGGDAAGGSKIVLEGNGMITDSGTSTLLGLWQGKTYYVGHSKYATTMRGSAARPTYNGNDIALYSDITAGGSSGSSGGSGGGLKLAARVTTTENSAAIAVTGLALKLPISIRMYNAGQNTGDGICISVNGNKQNGYAGVQNEDNSTSAKNRVWLYEADGKMISSVSLANFTATEAAEAYHTWNFVPSVIESIELTSVYHTDGGDKYYQSGTIVEIYEGVYPNVW